MADMASPTGSPNSSKLVTMLTGAGVKRSTRLSRSGISGGLAISINWVILGALVGGGASGTGRRHVRRQGRPRGRVVFRG